MKSKLVVSLAVSAGMLVAVPASAYVFTCVPPTEHVIGPKNPNVMLMLDVTGSMDQSSGEDVDGDGSNDSKLKVAKLAIDDIGNSIYTPGACTGPGDPSCDDIILGLSVFSGSQSAYVPGVNAEILESCAEDSAPAVIAAAYAQGASSTTNTDDAMKLLGLCPDLNDPSRPNIAVVITDGKPDAGQGMRRRHRTERLQQTPLRTRVRIAIEAVNPITTFMVGLGSGSIEQMNSVMAAAGGTGQCCYGATAPCAAADQVDPCSIPPGDIIASNTALVAGYECTGSIEATGSDLKDACSTLSRVLGACFLWTFLPATPWAQQTRTQTRRKSRCTHDRRSDSVPPAGRGMDLPTLLESFGMPAGNAATYVDEDGSSLDRTDGSFASRQTSAPRSPVGTSRK
ncbi:MAG: vWA domain-containing protein [bacterium]